MGVMDDLARAREAFERREWVAAYDALSAAGDALSAADFERLGEAALLAGRRNDSVQALQRAFQLHLDSGDSLTAARTAYWLAMLLMAGGESAVGGGWVSRCERLVDEAGGDPVERGYVLTLRLFQGIFAGRFENTLDLAVQVTEYGRRFRDADLLANGLNAHGRMLMFAGRVREGLALLDEAMVGVLAGQVSPVVAGETYCSLIEACQDVSDYGRAAEWTSALTRWIDEQPELVRFTGQCAVHRGQIMRLHGAFAAALEEYDQAMARYLADGHTPPAGLAMSERGDTLRVLGRFDEAEAAYESAIGYGHEPQPGLALLWLARGRTSAAVAAVRRVLGEPRGPAHRSKVLAGAADVLLNAGEVDEAAAVAAELEALAQSFGCRALLAMAHHATGAALAVLARPTEALPELRAAVHDWQALEATYEAARSRAQLGQVLRALGDEDSAVRELVAARRVLEEVGAVPDERRVAALLGRTAPGGLTEREVEVLRLVATGKNNPEIAATLVISEKTVARHLSNIFTKLDVTSRTAAAAYAFEHRLL